MGKIAEGLIVIFLVLIIIGMILGETGMALVGPGANVNISPAGIQVVPPTPERPAHPAPVAPSGYAKYCAFPAGVVGERKAIGGEWYVCGRDGWHLTK